MSGLASPVLPPQEDLTGGQKSKPDRELWFVLIGLTVLYAVALSFSGGRFVWFDELFTFDIARAPSLHRLWQMICSFDCNPPTSYLLSRWSMSIFGQNSWGLRLPSIIEFYLGSIAVLLYVRRKAGTAIATFSILMLWLSGAFRYAAEARPYALLFMSCAFLALSWDTATTAKNRKAALCVVALSSFGLFSAHAFGAFSLLPFVVAEGVRLGRRRKPDYPLWSALLLPAVVILSYIPMFETYQRILFPKAFQASLPRLGLYFYNTVESVSRGLLLALIAILILRPFTKERIETSKIRAEDIALFAGFLLSPLLLTLIQMRGNAAFWDRYGITTQVALLAAFSIWLPRRFGISRRVAWVAVLIMLVPFVHRYVLRPMRLAMPANAEALVSVRPDLPLVDNSMLTFFEMNHHESPELLSRVYYLKDRAAAIQYAHSTAYEDFEAPDRMKAYFPIVANVDSYSDFIPRHNQFLVLGTKDYPEDWLLRKVEADGASLEVVGDYPSLYKDSTLYLVTMPSKR